MVTEAYVVLFGNAQPSTADFGYVEPATVGDFVWDDLNATDAGFPANSVSAVSPSSSVTVPATSSIPM